MGRPRISLGLTEYRCIFRRAYSSGQWGGGCGKGFPIMGVAPKSREGTARQVPGFPRRLWGTSRRSKTKRRGAAVRNRDPLTNLRPRFLPPDASFPRPTSPPPRCYSSPRGTRRAAEAAAGTRSSTRAPWPISAEPEAPPRASRSPGGSSRGEPNRTEPSRAKPSRGRRAREAAARSPGSCAADGSAPVWRLKLVHTPCHHVSLASPPATGWPPRMSWEVGVAAGKARSPARPCGDSHP